LGSKIPRHDTALDDHHLRIAQLAPRELDLYGNQLARCLKALGTNAPIRVGIQRELTTVRAEQAARAHASEPGRAPDVSGLTPSQLERTRRELHASLALAQPGSPTHRPIPAHHLTRPLTPAPGRRRLSTVMGEGA
jgi:hypothetical protein